MEIAMNSALLQFDELLLEPDLFGEMELRPLVQFRSVIAVAADRRTNTRQRCIVVEAVHWSHWDVQIYNLACGKHLHLLLLLLYSILIKILIAAAVVVVIMLTVIRLKWGADRVGIHWRHIYGLGGIWLSLQSVKCIGFNRWVEFPSLDLLQMIHCYLSRDQWTALQRLVVLLHLIFFCGLHFLHVEANKFEQVVL